MTCRSSPRWEYHIGLRSIEDIGNGMGLRLTWGRAFPNNSQSQVHYNIYYSDTRFGVFQYGPKAITTSTSIVINSFDPGQLQYIAVRATEFSTTDIDISNWEQIGVGVYQYPDAQSLQEAIIDAYGTSVVVEDASLFPDFGFVKVNYEVMYYSSRTDNTLYVEDSGRGEYATLIESHDEDEEVVLWHGVEDGNSNILTSTATWYDVNPRNVDEIGEFNVDADGYRAVNEDAITPDTSSIDTSAEHFPSYDYTGYHRPSLQDTFSGECVGSYIGGEFNGGRGLVFQERISARLDTMLQVTGEPVILLRRKWEGKKCRCGSSDLRREHPNTRCAYCYGVGFNGGYNRFINTRPIAEDSSNPQGMINIRVHPWTDDLELVQDQGLVQPVELTAWTLSTPVLKDRDIIVRFNEDGTEEFRYEILDVTRNKLILGSSGKQQFKMRRHDKTDIIYTYDVII
jgi:hypothetical protein